MSQSPEREAFLEQMTQALCRYRLRLPALVALEAGRPLAFLGGQLLWLAQPALSLILPGRMIHQMARLLEEPADVEALITRLEAKEDQ